MIIERLLQVIFAFIGLISMWVLFLKWWTRKVDGYYNKRDETHD